MKDTAYFIVHKDLNVLQEDHNGMTCMFLDVKKANRYHSNLHPDDKENTEVVKSFTTTKRITSRDG